MAICKDPLQRRCWNPVLNDGMVRDPCWSESSKHWMDYTAGVIGLPGNAEPYWTCRCGAWRFHAQSMPRRKTGNNKIEAERSFKEHLVQMGKKVRSR